MYLRRWNSALDHSQGYLEEQNKELNNKLHSLQMKYVYSQEDAFLRTWYFVVGLLAVIPHKVPPSK